MRDAQGAPVRWYASLYVQVLIGAALGVALGLARAALCGEPETAR